MKVRDEKLGKFIIAMTNDEAHVFLCEQITQIREQHKVEREEDRWVTVKNGVEKKILVTTAVADTHDRVMDIKEDTQILRDFAGFFGFMKKYKGWYILGIIISLFFSHSVWQPLLVGLVDKL